MSEGGPVLATSTRIRGLDSLRFVLATWVLLGHVGYLPFDVPRHGAWLFIRGVLTNLVSGPAAVIAFFVVSGLCIHYPNRHVATLRVLPFYARREFRIVPPVVAAVLLGLQVGMPMSSLHESTLWSLVCEEIYYLLYPLLRFLFRRIGVRRLIALSFVVAYAIVIAKPAAHGNYPDCGWRLTWLVGLPCWLLGCDLAERIDLRADANRAPSPRSVWTLRAVVLVASMVCSGLRFHSWLTYPWTLDLFAIVCFVWIRAEIFYYASGLRTPRLEALGAASYSIYLVHPLTINVWATFGGPPSLALRIAFAFACSYAFYWIVERPSHRLARFVYHWMTRARTDVVPAAISATDQ